MTDHFQTGETFFQQGKYEEACKEYKQEIALNPNNADAYNNWGNALCRLKLYKEGIAKYREVKKLQPDYNALAYNKRGNDLFNLDKYEEAIVKYQQAIALKRKFPAAYRNWGVALHNLNKYEEAISKYQQAIEFKPEFPAAYCNWGVALYNLDKYEEAISKYQQAITLNPEFADAYCNWGVALHSLNKYEEAISKYQQAITLNPEFADAYCNWGVALYNLNKYEEAIEKYNEATQYKSNYAEAYYKWGNALESLKQYQEAISKYQEAIKFQPKYAQAYHNIAYIYWKQGAYKVGRKKWQAAAEAYNCSEQKAKQDKNTDYFLYYGSVLLLLNDLELAQNKYEAGLEINPNNIDILIALVDLYIQKNAQGTSEESSIDWGKARQYYRQVLHLLKDKESLDIESKDATTILNFGNLYFSMKEDEKAENYFLKALEKDSDSANVNSSLGALSIRKEDFKKSIDYFKKALNIDPDDLDVRSNLAQAYLKLKQLTKAESEYRKILGITAEHVESHIGLGEVYVEMAEAGEADIYSQAIRHFTKAIEISNNAEGSKQLSPKELAVVYYLSGYARVKFYENSMVSKDGSLLSEALGDFKNCVKSDSKHYKGERAKDKLRKQIGILSQPQKCTEMAGMLLVGILSLLIFSTTQWFFWQPFFIQAPKSLAPQESVNTAKMETNKNQKTPGGNNKNKTGNANNQALTSNSSAKTQPSNQINIAEYFLLTFGSLTFFLMSLYLPQLLKLKIGGTGIELEKSSVGISSTQTTATSLGISK